MSTQQVSSLKPHASRPRRGFTLAELLVVMGIMAILGVLTALSYRGIAKDAKLASGKNTVAAVLDNARGLAMKNNRIVVVVFRAQGDGPHAQHMEAITAQVTGDLYVVPTIGVVERFAPIPGTPTRLIPEGIQIATPAYGGDDIDLVWQAGSDLDAAAGGEAPGAMIGVMYAPDGTTISRNSATDSARLFIDFNNDRLQRQRGADYDNDPMQPANPDYPNNTTMCDFGYGLTQYFCQAEDDDEPYVTIAPFLAVFDEVEARSLSKPETWNVALVRTTELTTYINNNVTPIHFNRYSGVVMK